MMVITGVDAFDCSEEPAFVFIHLHQSRFLDFALSRPGQSFAGNDGI